MKEIDWANPVLFDTWRQITMWESISVMVQVGELEVSSDEHLNCTWRLPCCTGQEALKG